jgi:hypothetical protein
LECQKIALERNEKQKKELQGKVSLLQDQLDSIHTRSVGSFIIDQVASQGNDWQYHVLCAHHFVLGDATNNTDLSRLSCTLHSPGLIVLHGT